MASTAVQPQPAPRRPGPPGGAQPPSDILPTLFGGGYGTYQVRPSNYLFSFVMHCLAVALILLAAKYVHDNKTQIVQQFSGAIDISPYILPVGSKSGGGGGGGAHDKVLAEKGVLPKTARQQFTPPTVIVQNQPKLPIEPTVVAPEIKMKPANLGDPLAALNNIPSNGVGGNAGIGDGNGTGIGSGIGPGLGNGHGGGFGGNAYRIGGGVSPPVPLYQPEPEYSEEARKARYQGTVVVGIVVGADGLVHEARIVRSLGLGLDEKALETVKTYRFQPAKKDGQSVACMVNIEVNFRLF